MTIDLLKLNLQELKNLLVNAQKRGRDEIVRNVLLEMHRRGIATSRDFAPLTWNPDRVREVMEPFKKIASSVLGNQRTSYTEAGGLKIGLSKDHPDWRWIDTYSAIKTSKLNPAFICYVKQPGHEPEFQLRIDKVTIRSFTANQLGEALVEWRAVAQRATE